MARDTLRQRLRLMETIVSHAREALVLTELDDAGEPRIVMVNDAFRRQTGYEMDDVAGRHPRLLVGPDTALDAQLAVRRAVETANPVTVDILHYRRDGSTFWAENSITPVFDDAGRCTHVVSIQRDVTARVLRERFDRADASLLEMIARATPLTDTLRALTHHVRHNAEAASCGVFLADAGRLRYVAGCDYPATLRRAMDGCDIEGDNSPCGRAIEERQPHLVVDLGTLAAGASDERVRIAVDNGLATCWAFPVFAPDTPVSHGVLVVHHSHPQEPRSGEIELLARMATIAAVAVEHDRAQRRLTHVATHDALTDLPNRVLLVEWTDQAISRVRRGHEHGVAVLLVDIDGLKLVNEARGYGTGDQILMTVARRLEEALGNYGLVARFSGDEFALVCEGVSYAVEAVALAERALAAVAIPFDDPGGEMFLTACAGVAVATNGSRGAEAIVRDAHSALHRAKERGRNRYEIFEATIGETVTTRLALQTALHRALERREFRLHYQPIHEVATGRLRAVEALIRWRRPDGHMLGPAHFVPVAEETGLIIPIGRWVLEEACREAAGWRNGHRSDVAVAVNVSARQLGDPGLQSMVDGALRRSGLQATRLHLEVTEGAALRDLDATAETLSALRRLGVKISIDDFGTGYSSLHYLQRLPADVLKLDRSLVEHLSPGSREVAVPAAVVDLAHALDLVTVAEGIERHEQLAALRELRCDLAQGYHLGPPRPPAAIAALLVGRAAG